jgi:hypothetical protein
MIERVQVFRNALDFVRNYLLVLLLVGGSRSVVGRLLRMWQPNYAIIVDVEQELPPEQLLIRQGYPYARLPLARGLTSRALFADAPSEQRRLVENLAVMDAASGCGQNRGVGDWSGKLLIESPSWERTKPAICNELIIAAGGMPSRVRLISGLGIGGGTGIGAAVPLEADLATHVARALGINVHSQYNVTGLLTYVGLGDAIPFNAAAGFPELLAHVVRKDADKRINRSLWTVEYPPVRRDRAKREEFIRQDEQAFAASELQAELDRLSPNSSLTGPLGNIFKRQVEFFDTLDVRRVIAPELSSVLGDELRRLLAHAAVDETLVSSIVLTERQAPLFRESLDAVLQGAAERDFDELLASVCRAGVELHYKVEARLASGDDINLLAVASRWASPPGSPESALYRLVEQLSLLARLDQRLGAERARLDELDGNITELEDKLEPVHARLVGRGGWSAAFYSEEGNRSKFLDRAQSLRQLYDEEVEAAARVDYLQLARDGVQRELDFLRGHIQKIVASLDDYRPRSGWAPAFSQVIVRQLSAVWDGVWQLVALSPAEQLETLAACVAGVTVDGLATIVRADPARLETIADRIVTGKASVTGPTWAASESLEPSLVAYVLPPVPLAVAEELRSLLMQRNDNAIVAFTDTTCAGINVVRMNIHSVKHVEDVLPPMLQRHLQEVIGHPLAKLYLPSGTNHLRDIGVECNGQVDFGDLPTQEVNDV